MIPKRILYLSGTRADYGLMKTVLRAIENHPLLELGIIATAYHLSEEMGNTVALIEQDGFRIVDKIHSCLSSDCSAAMAKGIGLTLAGITQTFEREKPDMLVLLGDRGESLAAACAAALMGIAVVHIHCGDISEGHVDNLTRFAITQYSHILMPATEQSKKRLAGSGVAEKNIHVVGAPGLDDIVNRNFTSKEKLLAKFSLDNRDIITVLYHPASAEEDLSIKNVTTVLSAMGEFDTHQIVVIGGNLDAGGRGILKQIGRNENVYHFFSNLEREDYLGLLDISSVLVGNSSSGIIEAASFQLPVVNIGIRQKGRECAENVIHVDPDKELITKAINKALFDRAFISRLSHLENPYGLGNTGELICNILPSVELDSDLFIKSYGTQERS